MCHTCLALFYLALELTLLLGPVQKKLKKNRIGLLEGLNVRNICNKVYHQPYVSKKIRQTGLWTLSKFQFSFPKRKSVLPKPSKSIIFHGTHKHVLRRAAKRQLFYTSTVRAKILLPEKVPELRQIYFATKQRKRPKRAKQC